MAKGYNAQAVASFLMLEEPEFQRLVKEGWIPYSTEKGERYFDPIKASQGYIKYLRMRVTSRKVEEIAELFGVSIRKVYNLTQEGIIKTTMTDSDKGGRTKSLYDLKETCSALYAHLSDKAQGKSKADKELELKQKKLEAEIALKESQGELHRLKTDIAAGKYIEVEEVKLDYQRFFVILKKFITNVPNRVGIMINGYVDPVTARGIEKDLSKEAAAMLKSFVVAATVEERKAKQNAQEQEEPFNA
jgi:phage terminase Nu1 subunit (DNA packaging protein)